jgi:hypothetical protein
MGQEVPDAASFSRMVRRVEGLSQVDLKVMTLIEASLTSIVRSSTDQGSDRERPFVAASSLSGSPANKWALTRFEIQESLVDLAARGFLVPDGGTRLSKGEEYYFASRSFLDLMGRVRDGIKESVQDPPST